MDGYLIDIITKSYPETLQVSEDGHFYWGEQECPISEEERECQEALPVTSSVYSLEDVRLDKGKELSAMDLGTTAELFVQFMKNEEQDISTAQLLENFNSNDSFVNQKAATSILLVNSTLSNRGDYIVPSHDGYGVNCSSVIDTDYSSHLKNYSEESFNNYETNSSVQNVSNIATNNDPILLVDQGLQTSEKKTKDALVQLNLEPKILAPSLLKNVKEADLNFLCSVCQRTYATKNSYSHHLRRCVNHAKKQNAMNIKFKPNVKLQFNNEQVVKNQVTTKNKPIIKVIRKSECVFCHELFSTESEKLYHDCVIEPFPMTKCPECNFKFLTPGGLRDHLSSAHKKHDPNNIFYNCVFCNNSFHASYFTIHLDEHLRPPEIE